MSFLFCPIASKHIDTLIEAQAYWTIRLAGHAHPIDVRGKRVTIRMDPEETHAFTRDYDGKPCDPSLLVFRPREADPRRFDLRRARQMDSILTTLSRPVACVAAKAHRAVLVLGPAEVSGDRIGVVVYPKAADVWCVRTSYPVNSQSFNQYRRSRGVPWP